MEKITEFQLTQEYLQSLREAVEQRDDPFIRKSLQSANHADVVEFRMSFITAESILGGG